MSKIVVCDSCRQTITGSLPGYPKAAATTPAIEGRVSDAYPGKRQTVDDTFDLCAPCADIVLGAINAAYPAA